MKILLALPLALIPALRQDAATPRGVEFWRAVAADEGRVPDGETALGLALELSEHLGSPDPELRDTLAYGLFATWTQAGALSDDELLLLQERWSAGLTFGLEDEAPSPHAVLTRSFSALCLALLAARDLERPFLGPERFAKLFADARAYLANETDLRGWSADVGWMHSAAHTADLLKFLARSPHLTLEQQRSLCVGVADRLWDTDGTVFLHGEDERLAQALLSVLSRDDLDVEAFRAFVADVGGRHRREPVTSFDPVRHAGLRNAKSVLRHLFVRLSSYPNLPEELVGIRELTLTTLNAI